MGPRIKCAADKKRDADGDCSVNPALLLPVLLGIIAVLPLIVKAFTGISAVAVGGTGLLIVVSVVIDLVKKVDAQISAREY